MFVQYTWPGKRLYCYTLKYNLTFSSPVLWATQGLVPTLKSLTVSKQTFPRCGRAHLHCFTNTLLLFPKPRSGLQPYLDPRPAGLQTPAPSPGRADGCGPLLGPAATGADRPPPPGRWLQLQGRELPAGEVPGRQPQACKRAVTHQSELSHKAQRWHLLGFFSVPVCFTSSDNFFSLFFCYF